MLYDTLCQLGVGISASQRARERVPLHEPLKLLKPNHTNMKKTIIALLALAGVAAAAETPPAWNFVDNGDGTATYSLTLQGNYSIDLGELAIKDNESFTLVVETKASGWANEYGTGLVSTSNPYVGSNGDNNFRMYFGRPGHNTEMVVFGGNRWDYNSSEAKLTGVDTSAVPTEPSQSTPLTLGMIFTFDGSKMIVTNSENSQVSFSIVESNVVGSFNFATLTNTGAASIPNAETYISITKAVPEPTTATLSLLALAGLAARRRRK